MVYFEHVARSAFVFVLAILSFGVLSATEANALQGWITALDEPAPGNFAAYGSPEEACQAQYDSFVAPNGTFYGAAPTNDWWVYQCQWTGAVPYPTIVQYGCNSGFYAVTPGVCMDATSINRPILAGDTRPSPAPDNGPPPAPCGPCGGGASAAPTFGDSGNANARSIGTMGMGAIDGVIVGHPVDVQSGRLIETARDFETADGLLYVERRYSSTFWGESPPGGTPRGVGYGWQFGFMPKMYLSGSFNYQPWATFVWPDGTLVRYVVNMNNWERANQFYLSAAERSRYSIEIVGGFPSPLGNTTSSSHEFKLTDNITGTIYDFVSYGPYFTEASVAYIRYRSGYQWSMSYGSTYHELQTITDSFGRQLTFSWLNGTANSPTLQPILVNQIGLPDGTALNYTYAASFPANVAGDRSTTDHLVSVEHVVSPSGSGPSNIISTTTYAFEDTRFPWLMTGATDARGTRVATWVYDSQARVTSTTGGGGADQYQISYGTVTGSTVSRTVTNPLGKQTTYTWTGAGDYWVLTSTSSAASTHSPATTTSIGYSGGDLTSFTDEEGKVVQYSRAGSTGRPTAVTQAYGTTDARTQSYSWTGDMQLSQVVAPGLTTDYTYSGTKLVSVTQTDTTSTTTPYSTNGQTRTWAYTYTTEGLLATVDGPLAGTSDTVSYTYDTDGYLATVTDALGHTTTITLVDGLGHPLSVTDPNGVVTDLTYTPQGYLETVAVDPTGTNAVTTFGYNAVGDVTSLVEGNGTTFSFAYDAARRLTSVTDANGSVLAFTRDNLGNPTQATITDGSSTLRYQLDRTFDELGRLLSNIVITSAAWTYTYDKTSDLTRVTDPLSHHADYAYNGLRELISITDEASNTTTLPRNGQGEVSSLTDAKSVTTSYVRNGWGEVIQESSPDIGTVVYERNKLGLVTKKTDARGIESDYSYDQAGRLTGITYPTATAENVTQTYDSTSGGNPGLGHLTGFVDPSGTTSLVYNSRGLLASETNDALGTAKTTSYTYDGSGEVASITYPSGRVVNYSRFTTNQVSAVTTKETSSSASQTLVDNLIWYPFSNDRMMLMDFGNGLNLWQIFRTDYRPGQVSLYDNHSTPVYVHYYSYDDNEIDVTGISDDLNHANDETYGYTANHWLNAATGPTGSWTFDYDAAGNISEQELVGSNTNTFAYATGTNRISTITRSSSAVRTYTHDAAGNVLTSTEGGVTTTYAYNHADRMESYSVGANQLGAYSYNARGLLVKRVLTNTSANGTIVYFYDQFGHPIAEYDGISGALRREYIWLGDKPIAVIDPGNTGPVTYFIHTDHLNRPVAMSDASKALVARAGWEAYGALAWYTGTQNIDLRFPGQMYQSESAQHYNWFRQYDPAIGRYLQPDPIGLDGGFNRYAYVGNDPLQRTDENGLAPLPDVAKRMSTWLSSDGKTRNGVYDAGYPQCLIVSVPSNVILPKYIEPSDGIWQRSTLVPNVWQW